MFNVQDEDVLAVQSRLVSQNTSVEVMQAIEDDFSSHRDSPLHTQVSEYERCRGCGAFWEQLAELGQDGGVVQHLWDSSEKINTRVLDQTVE